MVKNLLNKVLDLALDVLLQEPEPSAIVTKSEGMVPKSGLKYITLTPPTGMEGPEIIIGIPKDKEPCFEVYKELINTEIPDNHIQVEEDDMCDEEGLLLEDKVYLAMLGAMNAAFAYHRPKEYQQLFMAISGRTEEYKYD